MSRLRTRLSGWGYMGITEASRANLFPQTAAQERYRLLRFVLRHVWLEPWRLRLAFAFARVFRNTGLAKLLLKSGVVGLFSRRGGLASACWLVPHHSYARALIRKLHSLAWMIDCSPPCYSLAVLRLDSFERVNEATKRVLRVNGVQTEAAPNRDAARSAAHAGDLEGARLLARQTLSPLARVRRR